MKFSKLVLTMICLGAIACTHNAKKEFASGSSQGRTVAQVGGLGNGDIDSSGANGASVKILGNINVNGVKSCALEVKYAGAEVQPVTWNGNKCSEIVVAFVSTQFLNRLNKLGRLTAEIKSDIKALPNGLVLYIEGSLAAGIYPMNSVQRTYSVSVAD